MLYHITYMSYIILWDKTPSAAYAERMEVFYLLEKRSVEVYNYFPV